MFKGLSWRFEEFMNIQLDFFNANFERLSLGSGRKSFRNQFDAFLAVLVKILARIHQHLLSSEYFVMPES